MRIGRQTGKEPANLNFTHFRWMSFVVEKDKPLDPMNVSFLRSVTVVPRSNRLADLVKQPRFRR